MLEFIEMQALGRGDSSEHEEEDVRHTNERKRKTDDKV